MTSASIKPSSGPARRTVVTAAGAAGLAVALTACGGSDDGGASSSVSSGGASGGGSAGASSGGTGGGDNAAGGTDSGALTTTADIPEGGGKVFGSEKVVVVQPSAGTYKAYSAVCTHAGCGVKSVADGVINCPCHNSNFSIEDGSVKSGPATKPLPEVKITVSGDSISLA
ncbi:Rieske (2Fe-2S) protein [Streptomyces antibioticus]|uniref:Cytochrome bc1 complex Rieske iron-sulfur subunit n=1 Tax=Streptomyces antibioticus TaxID=1890 RepID=A0AAE7CK56_STRAT|nr:Rieske (2Fe-2S) protein [Streptomyces antibioticus]OOQ54284.1 Rieske (2Fe-2S) protein [Streptomyces antibioticus]QIT43298.1 Rieske (2Fe-2S) protein [Streptomyces antibioticus]